jgi:hypothetical protein
MKKDLFKSFVLILGISLTSSAINAQTARVQVIHNCADALASEVDIYLGSSILFEDVAFRTATEFIDAPAGAPITISIAPGNSMSVSEAVGTFIYNLTDGETYILVADGILNALAYSPAPAFGISVYSFGREEASIAGNTDVLVHHGSTDAPTVDVFEVGVGAGTIVNDASYPAFSNYLELATDDYVLEVRFCISGYRFWIFGSFR